jgi:hypothetical protein
MKYRLSHSALDLLNVCERKFQLDRLLAGIKSKQDWPATVLGTAFGKGVASYLTFRDIDQAIFATYLGFSPVVEDEKRTEEIAVNLITTAIPYLENILMDWDIAVFNNKPAVELSFRLNIDEDFYFVGYIDIILRNKFNGRSGVLEVKTTALNLFDLDPIYRNSGQALGYSIVLDKILGESQAEYDVIYQVGQLGAGNGFQPKHSTLFYPKTLSDRLNWFITLGMDVERLHRMLQMNIFPMRGSHCLQYMRPCYHLGTCDLHTLDDYKEIEEDKIVYDFVYSLNDVIDEHLRRIAQ